MEASQFQISQSQCQLQLRGFRQRSLMSILKVELPSRGCAESGSLDNDAQAHAGLKNAKFH